MLSVNIAWSNYNRKKQHKVFIIIIIVYLKMKEYGHKAFVNIVYGNIYTTKKKS